MQRKSAPDKKKKTLFEYTTVVLSMMSLYRWTLLDDWKEKNVLDLGPFVVLFFLFYLWGHGNQKNEQHNLYCSFLI